MSSTSEFILSMLPIYGVRRETPFDTCDSRVVPNYEEIKPDENGICGNSLIVQKLIDYNEEYSNKLFRHDSHFCGICLEAQQGAVCVRVQLCGHIFCRQCIFEYLTINIANCNLRSLKCPDVDCQISFSAAQIREIVDEKTYCKFEEFSQKISVEDDPNLFYCPRNVCQSIARRCPELGTELGYCARCSFYFCVYCKNAYHGVQPCKLQDEERIKVIREYLDTDSAHKSELERRYTKQQIRKWVSILAVRCDKNCSLFPPII